MRQSLVRLCATFAFVVVVGSGVESAYATDFYLDSLGGDDSNAGHTEGAAWRSVAPLSSTTLHAGDHIYFKRGGTFDFHAAGLSGRGLELQASESGTSGNPILFSAYGTGNRPILSNPGTGQEDRILTINSAYVVVEQLEFTEAHYGGVVVEDSGDHVTVQDCETHHLGIGVVLFGTDCLVTRNIFRDGTMVVNTPGGDDDYGANGLVVLGSRHEISYNHAQNLIAPSMDYTIDGGFVEFYGAIADVSVHHNTVRDSDGFSECATGGSATMSNITYAYNESYNNGGFAVVHTTAGTFENIHYQNNTIVETTSGSPAVFWFAATAPSGPFIYDNNIVVLAHGTLFQRGGAVTHSHNIFYTSATLGITRDATDSAADPLFVDQAGGNFHLTASSPGVNAGVSTSFGSDLDGVPVPHGAGVDIGAYEFVEPGVDAGVVTDAGMVPDAGPPPVDSGMIADAGVSDSGSDSDSGTVSDSGSDSDSGTVSDSGTDSGTTGGTDSGTIGGGAAPATGCSVSQGLPSSPFAWLALIGLASALVAARRRRFQ